METTRPSTSRGITSALCATSLAALVLGGCSDVTDTTDPGDQSQTGNQAPTVSVVSPSSDAFVKGETAVTLEADADDPEEGELTGDAVEWSSDLDGALGTGATLQTSLSFGTHALTVTATDAEGDTAEDTVTVRSGLGEGMLVFEGGDFGATITTMEGDGSARTEFTLNGGTNRTPAWSPDGTRIAFMSDHDQSGARTGDFNIFVVNADGTGLTQLTTDGGDDMYPDWSPDGSRIAYHSWRDGNAEIYTMKPDGTDNTRLTDDPRDDWDPAWSPDGSRIAFVSKRDGNAEIYTMRADGSDVTRLTSDPYGDFQPAWSPDGSKIAFSSNRDFQGDSFNSELYVINADGTGVTRLTRNEHLDRRPVWSPDGSRIAWADHGCCQFEVYTMNPDGTGIINLTNNSDDPDNGPDWVAAP